MTEAAKNGSRIDVRHKKLYPGPGEAKVPGPGCFLLLISWSNKNDLKTGPVSSEGIRGLFLDLHF
jgi:hypothetical protein